MPHRIWIILWMSLSWQLLTAGHRADINADQQVDSTDLAILTNLLAGNLELSAYDLANIVVVSATGGDFSNPVAAAQWVTTQNPEPSHRFVIMITPGTYTISEPLVLPNHTTLRGYGPEVSCIYRVGYGQGGQAAVVVCDAQGASTSYNAAIYDLHLRAEGSPQSYLDYVTGVYVENASTTYFQSDVRLFNVALSVSAYDGNVCGLEMRGSNYAATVKLTQCTIDAFSSTGQSGHAMGVLHAGGNVVMEQSRVLASSSHQQYFAAAVFHSESEDYHSIMTAYDSRFHAVMQSGPASGAYYLYNEVLTGRSSFFNCMLNTNMTAPTTLGDIRCNCYDGDGLAVP